MRRSLAAAVFARDPLLIAGALNIIDGIGAIADANFWVGENHFVVASVHTSGWAL